MKTNKSLLLLYALFIWAGVVFCCEAATPSYERMKALIWKNTIHFIYEDNGMMEEYRENYGPDFFTSMADFDSLKNEALEKSFFLSVEQEVNIEGIARKIMLERLVGTIANRLSSHPNRKNDPAKLASVDSLQRTLYRLIQDEYQPAQYQELSASNAEEISAPAETDSLPMYIWFIIGLLILLLALTGLAFWRMMKMIHWVGEEMATLRQYVHFNTSTSTESNSQSLSHSHQQQLMTIQAETENIKEQVGRLYTLVEQTSSAKETTSAENLFMSSFDDVVPKGKQAVKDNRTALFYAKKPNNHLFKQETLFSTARHDSIYRIQEDTDGKATFTINEDKKVQDYALQNGGEMFLNEACEIQYENNRPVRIITEAPGKLVKEGKHWRIEEKAKVVLK